MPLHMEHQSTLQWTIPHKQTSWKQLHLLLCKLTQTSMHFPNSFLLLVLWKTSSTANLELLKTKVRKRVNCQFLLSEGNLFKLHTTRIMFTHLLLHAVTIWQPLFFMTHYLKLWKFQYLIIFKTGFLGIYRVCLGVRTCDIFSLYLWLIIGFGYCSMVS